MSFTVREVSAMLGLSASQIRAYAAKGFLKPERGTRGELRFGFEDLVILRTAGELAAAQVPERKVRRVLQRLREQLPGDQSITTVRIAADGERVFVREGDIIWNPESGQKLFDFAVSEIAEKAQPRVISVEADATDADDWYELALEREEDSAEEAKKAYERAIELDSGHVDAHLNLGRLLHEDGAPAAAEKHYRAALNFDPENEVAAFNLGVALEDLGRVRDAVTAYEKAIALDPDNADAHYNLAGLYERRGDKAGALRHLKAYRSLASGD